MFYNLKLRISRMHVSKIGSSVGCPIIPVPFSAHNLAADITTRLCMIISWNINHKYIHEIPWNTSLFEKRKEGEGGGGLYKVSTIFPPLSLFHFLLLSFHINGKEIKTLLWIPFVEEYCWHSIYNIMEYLGTGLTKV